MGTPGQTSLVPADVPFWKIVLTCHENVFVVFLFGIGYGRKE